MKREPPRELKPNQSTDLVLREMWRAKDALSAARGHSMVASHEPDGRALPVSGSPPQNNERLSALESSA